MKVLYIDHVFHTKTKSSDFFLQALKNVCDVDVVYIDPDTRPHVDIPRFLRQTRFETYDLVVVWQLEVIALAVLARGVPVVIVPMYDGCSAQPDAHWRLLSQAAALNFSLNLHLKTREVVPRQMLLQYYPDPDLYPEADHSDANRVFFWMRRSSEVSIEGAVCLTRGGFQRFHAHIAPDSKLDNAQVPDWISAYNVTTSTWFETRQEFDDLLEGFNVVVCPRLTEGIGMFMAECLARGMCVIAPGRPTHNEYIASGVNGFLFEPGNYSGVNLDRAAEMGRRARQGAYRGRERWLAQLERLPDFLSAVAERAPRPSLSPETADQLILRYFVDMNDYQQSAIALAPSQPPPKSRTVIAPMLPVIPPRTLVANGALSNYSVPPQVSPAAAALASAANAAPLVATAELVSVRAAMAKVPGWGSVKKFVPQGLKAKVASALVKRIAKD